MVRLKIKQMNYRMMVNNFITPISNGREWRTGQIISCTEISWVERNHQSKTIFTVYLCGLWISMHSNKEKFGLRKLHGESFEHPYTILFYLVFFFFFPKENMLYLNQYFFKWVPESTNNAVLNGRTIQFQICKILEFYIFTSSYISLSNSHDRGFYKTFSKETSYFHFNPTSH